MKNLIAVMALFVWSVISAKAQGLVAFLNSSATKISTNSTIVGAPNGTTAPVAGQYYYALYFSTNATSVNGQTAAISGSQNNNYAFNDPNWTLAAYGKNRAASGQLLPVNPGPDGVVIPGVAGGSTAQFVVIGWSANIGTNISAVQSWYNHDFLPFGWIGQSAVSEALVLGGGAIPPPSIFGISPLIQGFLLGEVAPGLYVPPILITAPTNLTVTAGSTAIFSAYALGDVDLTLSGQWLRNSDNIQNSYNYSMTISNVYTQPQFADYGLTTLTITNVQMTNAGYYSVYISNGAGSLITTNALLTVLLPPVQSHRNGNNLLISWPAIAGTYHVSAATNLAGPWADSGLTINSDGTTSSVSVTTTNQSQYFRLVYP